MLREFLFAHTFTVLTSIHDTCYQLKREILTVYKTSGRALAQVKFLRAPTADAPPEKSLLHVLLLVPAKRELCKTPRKKNSEVQRDKLSSWLSQMGYLRFLKEGSKRGRHVLL